MSTREPRPAPIASARSSAAPMAPIPVEHSPAARDHLVRALALDVVGPDLLDRLGPPRAASGASEAAGTSGGRATAADEPLPIAPSRWYLCGFLAPQQQRQLDDDQPKDDDAFSDLGDTRPDEPEAEPQPRTPKRQWPASMGMTLLLPTRTRSLDITVRWTDHVREAPPIIDGSDGPAGEPAPDGPRQSAATTASDGRRRRARRPTGRAGWRRVERPPARIRLSLDADALRAGIDVPDSAGPAGLGGCLRLRGELRPADVAGIRDAQALSLFLVNDREPVDAAGRADEAFAFAAELEVTCGDGLLPRPDLAGESTGPGAVPEWDDRVAALQYRDHREYAVGHGVSIEIVERATDAPGDAAAGRPTTVRTTWMPRASVPRIEPFRHPDITVDMDRLARLDTAAAVHAALGQLPAVYGAWLREQAGIPLPSEPHRETRDELLARADRVRVRIAEGIQLLADSAEVRRAFCLANRAMAEQTRQRVRRDGAAPDAPEKPGAAPPPAAAPSWRLFQLAFVLLNLPSVADPEHDDRSTVELIFFPTGGGKTEAYLGVIACALLLRRIRRRTLPDEGLGVAVLLRYTLRLLTLDQLGRAATLICALELLRREDPARLGTERFALGLWVGRSATANTFAEVTRQLEDHRHGRALSPFPLGGCPWCGQALGPTSFDVEGTKGEATRVVARCPGLECAFRAGIPVLFVDEEIYRELPCFVIATVDKFAMLPWRGETAALFGKVTHRDGGAFYGPIDRRLPRRAVKLPDGLPPPELIVQDELHLISGPLGTMVGLYETAVDLLCTRSAPRAGSASKGPVAVRPKILASTATVKRAREQVRALYARDCRLFPPPEVNASETFFARIDRAAPGRLYIGLCAPGRPLKAILIRSYSALITAAHACDPGGPGRPHADPYMTLVGYFNSLRELGGMRRLVESEVHQACLAPRITQGPDGAGWFAATEIGAPVELTSRESTFAVAQTKHALARTARDDEHVDVVLASNMISVGVDIDRLGLMVVAGQPKSTSEYIQATSRVGRDRARPGLVVVVLNAHKPRDRSYYEHFTAYHESFYRRVEATSVTPFAGPALDRGMAGALVAMIRLSDPAFVPPTGFMALADARGVAEAAVRHLAERARQVTGHDELAEELVRRGQHFLDAWQRIIEEASDGAGARTYSKFDPDGRKEGKPVLGIAGARAAGPSDGDEVRFVCPTSMRDVESSVHLWLVR